jgi:hypothetical protein
MTAPHEQFREMKADESGVSSDKNSQQGLPGGLTLSPHDAQATAIPLVYILLYFVVVTLRYCDS